MAELFNIISILGGILLGLSLILLGIVLIRRSEKRRGILFLLAGLALIILLIQFIMLSA